MHYYKSEQSDPKFRITHSAFRIKLKVAVVLYPSVLFTASFIYLGSYQVANKNDCDNSDYYKEPVGLEYSCDYVENKKYSAHFNLFA